MNNKYIEITIGNIVVGLLILFSIYVFSTGWECGFDGGCPLFDANGNVSPTGDKWQGFFRFLITLIGGGLAVAYVLANWGKSFKIPIPKITIKKEEDSEAWIEYQQWLKERNKDGNNK